MRYHHKCGMFTDEWPCRHCRESLISNAIGWVAVAAIVIVIAVAWGVRV